MFSRIPSILRNYGFIAVTLVLSAMGATAYLVQSKIEVDLIAQMDKQLDFLVFTLESGTTDSRVMGAVIQYGVENVPAKKMLQNSSYQGAGLVSESLKRLYELHLSEAALLFDGSGTVVSESQSRTISQLGRNSVSRPYFAMAMLGAASIYLAVDAATVQRELFVSAPVRDAANPLSNPIGAVSVKISAGKLDNLLSTWTHGPALLISPQGVVYASTRKDWMFHLAPPVSPERLAKIRAGGQFGNLFATGSPSVLPFKINAREMDIEGTRYVAHRHYIDWDDPNGIWQVLILYQSAPMWRQPVTAAATGFVGFILSLTLWWLRALSRIKQKRIRNYKTLNAAQQLLRDVTDNIPLAIFQVQLVNDGMPRASFINQRIEDILGVSADAALQEPLLVSKNVLPDDLMAYETAIRDCLTQKKPWDIEYRVMINGEVHWVHNVAFPVCGVDGIWDYNGYLMDITESKRVADEIIYAKELAEQALEDLRATQDREKAQAVELEEKNNALIHAIRSREDVERISRHDLKTPLGSIAAAPGLLRTGRMFSIEEEDVLSMIEKAANRALRMVNLSLDLYRMEKETYVFTPRPVDLIRMTTEVVQDLQIHARSKAVVIEVSGSDSHTWVEGEDALCYSIIANLLKNAVEAAPENSVVQVYIRMGAQVRLGIHNMGAVPERLRDNFFEKYSTEGKTGGNGLGTYSSYLMAGAQNGSLTMETSDTLGTTLTLVLKRSEAAVSVHSELDGPTSEANENAGASANPASGISQQRVLIVDDDYFNRTVLSKQLPQPPLEVVGVINGRVALAEVMRQRPDIIFMDIEMPVMGGIEALLRIREYQKQSGQLPSVIVAFSSNDDAESQAKYLELGFDRSLGKPSSQQGVLALLTAAPTLTAVAKMKPTSDTDVWVDADLAPEVPGFIKSRRMLVSDLHKALSAEDRELARKYAHKLAGSLGLFGFEWASDTCKEIERLAHTGDLQSMIDTTRQVALHLDHVQVQFPTQS